MELSGATMYSMELNVYVQLSNHIFALIYTNAKAWKRCITWIYGIHFAAQYSKITITFSFDQIPLPIISFQPIQKKTGLHVTLVIQVAPPPLLQ
jgi:hypothetical protein